MFDQQSLLLGGSLLVLVIVNIILGSVSSIFQQKFDKTKFWQGLVKGVIIVFCFVLVIIIGKLNSDIVVVNVNDQTLDLATATRMLMLSSYAWYGKEVYIKMTGFLTGKFKSDESAVEKTDKVD